MVYLTCNCNQCVDCLALIQEALEQERERELATVYSLYEETAPNTIK